ncbi:ANTAR domain-containing protein [Kineococcus rubinsiae]|uniref:ANTAR domain-containing protein n=1 Tax=Kineococcus rubinsiae TaxID=2609562 RepID=UPI001431A511|nr:GAF and ANTAR domain-containing protein [Kineococcus rubinsiae]NIZ89552.1 ANTAR domain-containing protein [Kineococcus rubinsiae]
MSGEQPPAGAGLDDAALARLVAGLSTVSIATRPTGEVLRHVAGLVVAALPAAADASLSVAHRGTVRFVEFAGRLASVLDERQHPRGFLPSAPPPPRVLSVDTAPGDTAPEGGGAEFRSVARRHGVRRALIAALPPAGDFTGTLVLYLTGADAAGDPGEAAVAEVVRHVAVPVLDAAAYEEAVRRAEQLTEAMRSRAGIEQAKGILVAVHGCSPDEAFVRLSRMSQQSNRKLREVAEDVVAGYVRGAMTDAG